MDGKATNSGAWHGSLGVRFLTIVCLALLPVSALSVWQGVERIRLDQQSARQILRDNALAAASDELNAFVGAEQLLTGLAKEEDIRLGQKTCERRFEDSLRGLPLFDNVARISPDGKVLCAAVMPSSGVDPTKSAWWKEALMRREFFVAGPIRSAPLRKDVFLGVLPLARPDGTFDGTLNVAIDIQWLTFVHGRQLELPRGAIVAVLEKSGTIVASNAPDIAQAVFAGGAGLPKGRSGVTSVTGPNDEPWSLAIAPVSRHEYYVGFAMPDSELTRLSYMSVAVDLLLPLLMILLASLAILLATNRLVVRWTETLGRMANAYGKGHYSIRPQALHMAPREFQILGTTLEDMASAVQERDRSLKVALAQKELLVKEIHHRVKNTLQIVMSLLNLQSNRIRDADAREALDQGRARISVLALAYRTIYEHDLDGAVELKPLLTEAIEQVQRDADDAQASLTLSVHVAPCKVNGDTAIPLLLFVNEAMSNAYRYRSQHSEAAGHISVSLLPAGAGRMDLVIADDGAGPDAQQHPETNASLGARLMQALAQQVAGEMTIGYNDGGGTVVRLNFAAQPDTTTTQSA